MCSSNVSTPKTARVSGRHIGLTPDDQQRMAELYTSGQRRQDIADLFGCSINCIYDTLKRLGVKTRRGQTAGKIPWQKYPKIIQLHEAGQSYADIAKEFGCSSDCIFQIIQQSDGKTYRGISPVKFSEDICQKMIDMYKQGHTLKSVTERFGCSMKSLHRIFDDHGVERHVNRHQINARNTKDRVNVRYTKDRERMVAMHEQGKSLKEIAEEIGYSRSWVTHILKKLGIETRRRPRHIFSPEDREVMVELYRQGKNNSEIAAKIGFSRSAVRMFLYKCNVLIRKRGAEFWPVEDQQKMVDLYENGMSLGGIAIGFNCGKITVKSILQKHGIIVRSQRFVGQLTPTIQKQTIDMYESGYSEAEIAAKFGFSIKTVAAVIDIATRKSQIHQPISTTPNSNVADDPVKNTESPAPETPSQIPLETLVRNFWADKARAVDVLLLPPDLRLKITESVEQALVYAWNTFGNRE